MPSTQEARSSMNRGIVDAKCWAFVRKLHLYRYPNQYTNYWQSLGTLKDTGAVAYLTDLMELDPQYSLKQKASWMASEMNYVFNFLSKNDGIKDPSELRLYILKHVSGNIEEAVEYRDENGSLIAPGDLLPTEKEWGQMVTGQKRIRLNENRFYDWLEPRTEPNWPELPKTLDQSTNLPGNEEFRPFEKMGGILVNQTLGELDSPFN